MSETDQSLEQLLSRASPRPVPSHADTDLAREAVRAEWHAVSGKHRSRRRLVQFATAATVVIGLASLFGLFSAPAPDIVKVASIQKSLGSIYFLGEHSELTLADELVAVHTGQTIVTGDDGLMALSWGNGGSVRLDKATEVAFLDKNTVQLRSGRLYFDSVPYDLLASAGSSTGESFQVETQHGVVAHVGTQFMTEVDSRELIVSVREGQVEVKGQYYPHTASRGEQVVFSGRNRPVVLDVSEYGDAWDWVGLVSPAIDVDGKSVHSFLTWASRELGMSVKYADEAVEHMAREALLEGRVDRSPAEALRLRMLTAALDWRFVEGVIYVSNDE